MTEHKPCGKSNHEAERGASNHHCKIEVCIQTGTSMALHCTCQAPISLSIHSCLGRRLVTNTAAQAEDLGETGLDPSAESSEVGQKCVQHFKMQHLE